MNHARLLFLSAIFLAACGPLKDMSDMKDTTNHMDQTTTHMDQTTSDMDKKTSTMSDQMGQMTEQIAKMGGQITDMGSSVGDMRDMTKTQMNTMIDEMRLMKSYTEHMSTKMDGMYDLTTIMSGDMKGVLDLTHQMLGKMQGLYEMTKDVFDTSKHMSITTDRMLDLTNNLYTDNRQNGSLITRYYMLSALDDEKMTPGLAIKASIAAKYFMAFEFQVWKNHETDNPEKREALEGNAIQEFFLEMRPFMGGYTDYSPLSILNSTKNLMMISVTMDQANPNQLDAAKEYGFTPLTLDQILINGLKKKNDVNSGKLKPIPPQVDQVLQNEEAATYILNVRHNTLAMVALTKIIELDPDYLQKSYGVDLAKKIADLIAAKRDLSGQNIQQMDIEMSYLTRAIQVRQDLDQMGADVKISPDVEFMIKQLKVTLDLTKLKGATKSEVDQKLERVQKMNQLIAALNNFHHTK